MEEEEFKPFFDKWYRVAMASASRFLWRHNDIEDVVMDSFLATWKNLYKLRFQTDAARFLFYVLKRRCINKNNATGRSNEISVYDMESDEEDYNLVEISAMLTVDLIEKFQTYVTANCTDRQKEIISHFMLGKNNKEIGSAIGINHRTVSSIKLHVFDNFKKWHSNANKL